MIRKILFVLLISLATLALASSSTPTDVVRDATEELRAVVTENKNLEAISEVVSPRVDWQYMSALLLGPYWTQISANQQERFIQEWQQTLLRVYGFSILKLDPDTEVKYVSEKISRKGHATVTTQIPVENAKPLRILYRLRRHRQWTVYSGYRTTWKVYDMVFEGTSLVITYRPSYRNKIKYFGIERLLRDMHEKNNEN